MADVLIASLPAVTGMASGDLIPVQVSGVTSKITAEKMMPALAGASTGNVHFAKTQATQNAGESPLCDVFRVDYQVSMQDENLNGGIAPYEGAAIYAHTSWNNSTGTAHAISGMARVHSLETTQDAATSEICPLFLSTWVDQGGCNIWGTDQGVIGPPATSTQANYMMGASISVNSYHPTPCPSGSYGLVVSSCNGMGTDETWDRGDFQALQSYTCTAGIAICGKTTGTIKAAGFHTALQIGGSAAGWAGLGSWFEKALTIQDYDTCGIEISAPKGNVATVPALEVKGGTKFTITMTKPEASSTVRGMTWVTQGGAGVADTMEICLKSAAGTYSWKVIATG